MFARFKKNFMKKFMKKRKGKLIRRKPKSKYIRYKVYRSKTINRIYYKSSKTYRSIFTVKRICKNNKYIGFIRYPPNKLIKYYRYKPLIPRSSSLYKNKITRRKSFITNIRYKNYRLYLKKKYLL